MRKKKIIYKIIYFNRDIDQVCVHEYCLTIYRIGEKKKNNHGELVRKFINLGI